MITERMTWVRLETLCGCSKMAHIPYNCRDWRVPLKQVPVMAANEYPTPDAIPTRTFEWAHRTDRGIPVYLERAES